MRIYVGNLAFRSSEQDVSKAFAKFGEVSWVKLAIDPLTGRSAGHAQVEMPHEEQAMAAIERLNGREINSRIVNVSVAVPDAELPPRRDDARRRDSQRPSSASSADGRRGPPRRSGGPSGDRANSPRDNPRQRKPDRNSDHNPARKAPDRNSPKSPNPGEEKRNPWLRNERKG